MKTQGMVGATHQGLGPDAKKTEQGRPESGVQPVAKPSPIEQVLSGTQKGLGVRIATKAAPTTPPPIRVETPAEPPPSPMGALGRLLAATQRGLGLKLATRSAPIATPALAKGPAEKKAPAPKEAAKVGASVKVVMASGLYKTAAGVVGQRLIKEHAAALRAYLTVQMRDGEAAQRAIAAIEDDCEQGITEEIDKAPTKKAGLFLSAKNLVEYERLFGDGLDAPMSAVPWEPTPPGRPDGWGRGLDEVRFGLGAEEQEILQLHVCAGLTVEELSYVLGVPRDAISRKVEAALGYAKLLLEDVFDEAPALDGLLTDAFQIAPPTAEQLAAARPKVVPLPAGTVIGDRYEIESKLGGGEFAYVYRARDVRVPGHVVALKLLHRSARTPAAREGAIRELSLIASAFHPSLVQFKDHGWFEERLWFVMPFYQGELLLDRIRRGPLPLDDALAHFERLARALAALHAAGIRHQDIKPENLFLVELRTGANEETPETLPILLDLGVAAPNGEMALAGTPMYFPPEVAARIFDEQASVPLTPKADVFALALSLLHSVEEADLSDLQSTDVDGFLRKRSQVVPSGPRSPELAFLKPCFTRWLSPDPAERPSAGELADEIAALRAERMRGTGGVAPKKLRTLLVGATLAALFAGSAMLTDAPPRTLEVVQGAPAAELAPSDASERELLLQERLRTEESRSQALEDELTTLRRRQLRLPE